ncbi:helix-turn-helix domain-containing protein [Fischerella sp. PCC 9605]|uniref:helix-turn-helix domain-containing protein n=1 Tax=Fischerella sp. PCC 9605 TaxID=1173024 RepID=UPI000479E41A|nr:helix-turn-helix transcriptional regulator [Fischerella sp. PCC 9605]
MPRKTAVLEQPQVSNLVRELRQLMALSQEQFAARLGVAYSTINRWENGHMQPSPLALKQIKAVLNEMNHSPMAEVQERSQKLLDKYFPEAEPS